jgi:hypothetical protein
MRPACVMATETGVFDRANASTADERWAAWVARGVEHDIKIKKRAVGMAALVAGGVALWLAIALVLG